MMVLPILFRGRLHQRNDGEAASRSHVHQRTTDFPTLTARRLHEVTVCPWGYDQHRDSQLKRAPHASLGSARYA